MMWQDLLGRPFRLHGCGKEGMDCSTVAEEILRRLGKTPPSTSPFRGRSHSGQEMEGYFETMSSSYEKIGQDSTKATQNGDVVLSYNKAGDPTAMFVLVDQNKGTFLTSEHGSGVRATRRFLLGEVYGVYRLRGKSND